MKSEMFLKLTSISKKAGTSWIFNAVSSVMILDVPMFEFDLHFMLH